MDLDEFVSWTPEKPKKTYFIRNGRMGRDKHGNMIIKENEEDNIAQSNSNGMVVLGIVVGLLLLFVIGNYLLYRYATSESSKRKKMIKKAVSKKKMKRERLKQGIFVPGE